MHRALQAFYAALYGYLRANGKRALSIAKVLGQREVFFEKRGLYRYHDPSSGYALLEEALAEIEANEELRKQLEEQGIRLTRDGVTLTIEALERLVREAVDL